MNLIKKITASFLLAFLLIPSLAVSAQEATPCEMNPELPECTEFPPVPPISPCEMNPTAPECLPPIPEIPCEVTETCVPTSEGPTLTVIKELIQDNGGTAEVTDFNYYVGESQVYSGEANEFSAGTYSVSESYPSESEEAKYSTTFSGDCNAEGQVTMDGESSKICTITNNDIAANLNVVVEVINDNGGSSSASSFPIHVTATDPSDANFNGVSGKGYAITLDAGSYSVTSSGLSNYSTLIGENCSGTIGLAEYRTCVITFDDKSGGGGGSGGSASFGAPSCSGSACGGSPAPTTPSPTAPNPPVVTTPAAGEVLGETIDKPEAPKPVVQEQPAACTPYLNSYIKYGRKNNVEDVKKLQRFLNQYMNAGLEVTGKYDLKSFNAVKAFQVKESGEVLSPWSLAGIKISKKGTGYVYKTTKRRINNIMCASLNLPMPELR